MTTWATGRHEGPAGRGAIEAAAVRGGADQVAAALAVMAALSFGTALGRVSGQFSSAAPSVLAIVFSSPARHRIVRLTIRHRS